MPPRWRGRGGYAREEVCGGCKASSSSLTPDRDGLSYCSACWIAYYGKPPGSDSIAVSKIPVAAGTSAASQPDQRAEKEAAPATARAESPLEGAHRSKDVDCVEVACTAGASSSTSSSLTTPAGRFAEQTLELQRLCGSEVCPDADEAQLEEVEALRSIYGDDLRVLSEEGERPMRLRLEAPSEIEGGGAAQLLLLTSDGEVPAGEVKELPPVALLMVLPPHYPLEGPGLPMFSIEAKHLAAETVKSLESELRSQAEQREAGEPLLFDWTCTLRDKVSCPARLLLDEKQFPQADPMQLALDLLAYDSNAREARRKHEMQVCPVCFDDLPGSRGIFLSCGHFACRACLTQMAQLHTAEADVASLRCPLTDCRQFFGPEVLRELLGAESAALQKWEELSLKQCLDRMQDVVYCPRCDLEGDGQRIPCIQDEDHMARCEVCDFVFCGRCRSPYHPGIECTSADDRMEALEARAAGTGPEAAAARAELLTLRHLAKTTKNCPRCQMAIEKSEGCSKVTCRNCNVHFCWRCGKEISGYDHFATSECRLFDDEEIRRWNQRVHQVDKAQARAHEARFLQQFIDPAELARQARECPRCKAVVVREGKNNHLRCYACLTQFCARCFEILPKTKAGEHFTKFRICPQHSDD